MGKRWFRRRRRDPEIAPDEIFLDATNASDFDRSRFEGRIERPLPRSSYLLASGALVILFVLLLGRSANLQLFQGAAFAAQSEHNSLVARTLFAPRGIIEDRNGVVLAQNVERDTDTVRRSYPLPEIGQILGYVSYPKKDTSGRYYDTAQVGLAGLEKQYDDVLSGENGRVLTETDALGNVRSEGTIVPAVPGGTLTLTIDAELERAFAAAIAEIGNSKKFIAGAGVIMDVHTGEVRAIVSYPSYDPNIMSSGGPSNVIASYTTDPGHPFLDHVVQGVYAPGSIVKPFISAGVLTDGLITPSTIINDPGFISLPDPYHPGKNFVYKGWKPLGPVDVRTAIAWSSDVFFYTVGGGFQGQKGLGIDRLGYWYKTFGLGAPTGINLPGEVSGVIPSPAWKEKVFGEPWYLGDTYFTAIGQYSMQVTPIQMARATAALVNGGKLLTPTLVAGEPSIEQDVPVAEDVFQVVREGMRKTVTSALASALNLPYVSVAAKTGTAQVGTRNQFDNAWVIGFFPYEAPQYSFAVVLERGPEGTGEQSVNVMRDLFERLHAENSLYTGGTGTSTPATRGE